MIRQAAQYSIFAVLLVATSCNGNTHPATTEPILRIGFGIGNSARTSVRNLTDLLYVEPLLARDWNGRQTGRLVSNWTWEERDTLLRLRLKPGVVFHDGTPLNAGMVRQILETARSDANFGFENVIQISAPTADTVTVRLSRPDFFLVNGLADRPIVKPGNPDVGTGPFRLVRRSPSVLVDRHERYHGGKASPSRVEIVTYDTTRSAWAGLMRNDVDAVQEVNPDSVDFMKGNSAVATYTTLQPFHVPFAFNLAHPALAKVEVRRALAEALNRADILKRAMKGHGRLAEAPIWPNHWAHSPPSRTWAYSPESAKRRLDRAGFPVREGKDGRPKSRFALKCMVYKDDPQYERIALMIQRQLFDVGVDLEIELIGLEDLGKRLKVGEFDTYIVRVNAGRSMDYTYRFWYSKLPPSSMMQKSGYTGVDDALDRVRASLNEEQVRIAVAELASQFYQDVPAVFIAWLEVTRAVSTRYEVANSAQDPLFDLWRWRSVAN